MSLREFVRHLVYGPKASSKTYVEHLRSLGMVIGGDTVIYSPTHCVIDATRPWMVEIGRNVQITEGVIILTHGYDWSVLKGRDGWVLGSAGHVRIGNNVFIGMDAIILKGVTIGDNVVIGAGSVVTHDIPSGSLAAGNPAHVIGDVDSYLEKRCAAQVDEAADLYDCWRRNSIEGRQGRVPPREIFREFFWLFEEGEPGDFSCLEYENVMALCGTLDKSERLFRKTERAFGSYDDFLAELERRRPRA
jgi:acetyltransferase-like isoleucine patch superfamily enzyme